MRRMVMSGTTAPLPSRTKVVRIDNNYEAEGLLTWAPKPYQPTARELRFPKPDPDDQYKQNIEDRLAGDEE